MPNLEDRTRVQTVLDVNMVVEAGAGTGKTTLLIDRLCLCVLVQNIPVEKVVALTFTEKAAAEIKTRFILKLQQLVQAIATEKKDDTLTLLRDSFGMKDSDIVVRAQAALARLDRASIGTIHSFCAEILKTFPLEAGLTPNAQIDSGGKGTQLFEARWNHFLDEQLGVNASQAARWKQVLAEISLEELKAFAWELARLKPVEYDYFAHREILIRACQERAAQAATLYQAYAKPGKKPRALEKALSWAETSLQRTVCFLKQTDVPPAPPEGCPSLPAAAYKDWAAADFEEAHALVTFAQKVTPEVQTIFLTAYELLIPLASQVRADLQAQGVLGFDDLIIQTRNLLQQNLYVRRLLKEKFAALFIDEFQDTDPVQGEMLLFLAEEKSGAATRWQEVRLEPGKLFVVGDPKQSIYRFRGADITAYELFTRLILAQGGEKCFLRRNFRSKAGIVELTNQVCSRAMLEQPSFQPAYEPIFTSDPARTQAVQWLFVQSAAQDEKYAAEDLRHNQAEAIARWIKEHVGVEKLSDGRLLSLGDIALLTRVGTNTRIFTDALRRYGLAFTTETDKDFFHKQEINDLLLFLRVLADNQDKIALAGVLRSPFGGLTDEELTAVALDGFSWPALAANPKTQACIQCLTRFTRLAGRVSVGRLIERILTETFLPQACAMAYDGEQTLATLQQFAGLAAQYETDRAASLPSFLNVMQKQVREHPDEMELPFVDEVADAVSILTVHKSKGLEFPVVILADLSRKESAPAAHAPEHLFSWQYAMYGLRAGKIADVNLAFLEEEQKKHSRCEEVRVLYVALTRAKEKLVLVADDRAGVAKAVAPFVAAGLFPAGEDILCPVGESELAVPVDYVSARAARDFIYTPVRAGTEKMKFSEEELMKWRATYQARLDVYEQMLTQAQKQAPSQLEDSALLSVQQRQAAQLGSICHRALELLLTGRSASAADACVRAAQQAGAPERACEAQALVEPFVACDVFAQLRACRVLACEMPFSMALADGTVQSGLMDAVLQQPDGTIWVVDYKTDQVIPGKEPEVFAQKYRAQLQVYQSAAKKLFAGKTVRATALFIRTFAAVDL